MKLQIVSVLIGLLVAQSASALSQCPSDVEICGPNPFYVLLAGFSQVCSEVDAERSSEYQSVLARMVAENPKAYAKVDADAEFQKKLDEVKRHARLLSDSELKKECSRLLSNKPGRE